MVRHPPHLAPQFLLCARLAGHQEAAAPLRISRPDALLASSEIQFGKWALEVFVSVSRQRQLSASACWEMLDVCKRKEFSVYT